MIWLIPVQKMCSYQPFDCNLPPLFRYSQPLLLNSKEALRPQYGTLCGLKLLVHLNKLFLFSIYIKGNTSTFTGHFSQSSILLFCNVFYLYVIFMCSEKAGGVVAQLVERVTPYEEVPGSIPTVASRSLLVGSMSV